MDQAECVTEMIEEYYRQTLFLVFPKVCNARCSFCYLNPVYSERAELGPDNIRKLQVFLQIIDRLGFNEIRITGGEPLLFDDIGEVMARIKATRMRYTLLTNGINLSKYVTLLCRTGARNITVSLHGLEHHGAILRAKLDTRSVIDSIEQLLSAGIRVTIALVFLRENAAETLSTIECLAQLGVRHFKLIYPNSSEIGISLCEEFADTVRRSKDLHVSANVEIRCTDFEETSCLLRTRGFLSLTMPDFRLWPCCAALDHGPCYWPTSFDERQITSVLVNVFRHSHAVEECLARRFIPACPLSLKSTSEKCTGPAS